MSSLIPKGYVKKEGGKSVPSLFEKECVESSEAQSPAHAKTLTDPKPIPIVKKARSKKTIKPSRIPIDIKTDIVYFIGKCETQHWRKGENIMSKDMKRRREKVLKYLMEDIK